MNKKNIWLVCFLSILGVVTFLPDLSFAQGYGGGDFEGRIQGFTSNLISVILPAVSILGLLYAAMLAASGDEGAKKRMTLVVIASVVGFLAPLIIRWFQSAVGG